MQYTKYICSPMKHGPQTNYTFCSHLLHLFQLPQSFSLVHLCGVLGICGVSLGKVQSRLATVSATLLLLTGTKEVSSSLYQRKNSQEGGKKKEEIFSLFTWFDIDTPFLSLIPLSFDMDGAQNKEQAPCLGSVFVTFDRGVNCRPSKVMWKLTKPL